MKYLDDKFTVPMSSEKYRENFDKIFGKASPKCSDCGLRNDMFPEWAPKDTEVCVCGSKKSAAAQIGDRTPLPNLK